MLPSRRAFASAPGQPAEAEVAVGDERTHAAPLGERERLAIVGLGLVPLGVGPIRMGRDVAEQVQRVGREARVRGRIEEGALGQATGLVEPAEQQRGPTQGVAGLSVEPDDSPPRLTLEELLALLESGHRDVDLVDLGEGPRRAGHRVGQVEHDVPGPVGRDPVLDQGARPGPVPLEQV